MNTKISDAVDRLAQVIRKVDGNHSLGAGALAESIIAEYPKLAADAVPVGHVRRDSSIAHMRVNLPEGTPLYVHPQPAALKEVSGNSGELGGSLEALREALRRHDEGRITVQSLAGSVTDYLRLNAALAATGKQQGGEAQGDGGYDKLADLIARLYMARDMGRAGAWSYLFAEAADALAARQPVGQEQREGCTGTMSDNRVAFFLRRFKREEKLLGPHEQWAVDVAISRFEQQDSPPAQGIDLGQFRPMVQMYIETNEKIEHLSDVAAWAVGHGKRLLAQIDQRDAGSGVSS